MKRRFFYFLLILTVISACTPSQEEIQATVQASIAETQRAMPTDTRLPTETPIPTATATATATVTITPSPTPDARVIDIDPRELLLAKSSLPPEGQYYLPGPGWISPATNSEIVSAWTVKEGQAYLAETGRIHGWLVNYRRGKSGVLMPEEIYDNVTIYSNIEGARLVITKYGNRRVSEEGFTEIDVVQIGDATRAFMRSETTSGGDKRVQLMVSFSYRNIAHTVALWGWDKEISLDFAVDIAQKLLSGLEQLPLSKTVIFAP